MYQMLFCEIFRIKKALPFIDQKELDKLENNVLDSYTKIQWLFLEDCVE